MRKSRETRPSKIMAWALVYRDYDNTFFDIEEIWLEKPKGSVFSNTEEYELIEVEIRPIKKAR